MFYALSYGLVASNAAKIGFLIALTFLACIEKLCSIMNLVSVEKDWVCNNTLTSRLQRSRSGTGRSGCSGEPECTERYIYYTGTHIVGLRANATQ